MPFNLANVAAARSAAHLRPFTCALSNGIAIRGHVRGRKERGSRRVATAGRRVRAAPPTCKVRV